jgi:hypothetical protein
MPVQQTSRDAYRGIKLSQGQLQIIDSLTDHGPQTDLELMSTTGMKINAVTGRRNELVGLGAVRNSGRKKVAASGWRNIVWELVPEAERAPIASNDPKLATQLKLI